jgi:succinate-acetate transporter protein
LFTTMMLVCSIRTNIIFFLVFLTLDFGFIFVTVSDWYGAEGDFANFKYYRVVSFSLFAAWNSR